MPFEPSKYLIKSGFDPAKYRMPEFQQGPDLMSMTPEPASSTIIRPARPLDPNKRNDPSAANWIKGAALGIPEFLLTPILTEMRQREIETEAQDLQELMEVQASKDNQYKETFKDPLSIISRHPPKFTDKEITEAGAVSPLAAHKEFGLGMVREYGPSVKALAESSTTNPLPMLDFAKEQVKRLERGPGPIMDLAMLLGLGAKAGVKTGLPPEAIEAAKTQKFIKEGLPGYVDVLNKLEAEGKIANKDRYIDKLYEAAGEKRPEPDILTELDKVSKPPVEKVPEVKWWISEEPKPEFKPEQYIKPPEPVAPSVARATPKAKEVEYPNIQIREGATEKGQDITYRGQNIGANTYNPNEQRTASYGYGLYSTKDIKQAGEYGIVHTVKNGIPKNPLSFNTHQDFQGWLIKEIDDLGYKNLREFNKTHKIGEYIASKGYDGVKIGKGNIAEYVLYPESILKKYRKTETQLKPTPDLAAQYGSGVKAAPETPQKSVGASKPPAPSVSRATPKAKEAWEMSANDYIVINKKTPHPTISHNRYLSEKPKTEAARQKLMNDVELDVKKYIDAEIEHKTMVEQAAQQGKIGAGIQDYPDLMAKYGTGVKPAPETPQKPVAESKPPVLPVSRVKFDNTVLIDELSLNKRSMTVEEGQILGAEGIEQIKQNRLKAAEVPKPTTPENVVGLNKKYTDELRERMALEKIPPHEIEHHIDALNKAKAANLERSALTLADDVIKTGRAIDATEVASLWLKVAELSKDHELAIETQNKLSAKGDPIAASQQSLRAATLLEQIDILTEAARYGKRQSMRSGSISRIFINRDDYSIAKIMQQAKTIKTRPLTPAEIKQFEDLGLKNKELETKIKELEAKEAESLANQEKIAAQKMIEIEGKKARISAKTAERKTKLLAERADIKKQLQALGMRVNDITGATTEASYLIGRLAINYAKEGAVSLNEVVAKMLVDLPQITERDIYKALNARNPKVQQKAAKEVQTRIKNIKKQAALVTEIDKLSNNLFEPDAYLKMDTGESIKALKQKLRELRKASWNSDLTDVRLERVVRRINELQDQLDNNYRPVKGKKAIDPPELASMKEKAKEIQRLIQTKDSIARLEDQLRTGEFEVKAKEPKPMSLELEKAKIEQRRLRRQIRMRQQDLAPKTFLGHGKEAINFLRTARATADFSANFRQAAILLASQTLRHPTKAAETLGTGFKSFFKQYTAEQVDLAIRESPNSWVYEKHKLYLSPLEGARLTAREEMFQSRWAEKIPYYRQVVMASERHMTTTLNMLRSSMADEFIKKFPNATKAELDAYFDFLNCASGRGNIEFFGRSMGVLNTVFFAPRFAVSRVQTPYKAFQYWKMPRVRNQIAKDMGAYVGVGVAALTLAKMGGAEVGLDPLSPDFGKIRIGNVRYDIWAGFQQPARLVARTLMLASDKAGFSHRALLDSEKEYDPIEGFMRFASYKFSPMITLPKELITGKTMVGQPTTPQATALRTFTPLFLEDVWSTYKSDIKQVPSAVIFGSMGTGVSTYADSETATRIKIKKLRIAGKMNEANEIQKEWNLSHPKNRIATIKYPDDYNIVKKKKSAEEEIEELLGGKR